MRKETALIWLTVAALASLFLAIYIVSQPDDSKMLMLRFGISANPRDYLWELGTIFILCTAWPFIKSLRSRRR